MALIIISANTETKELTVTIDGSTISDVEDASVYTYRDSNGNVNELGLNVFTQLKEENGVSKRVTYHAYSSPDANMALASGEKVYKDIEGFVGVEEKDPHNTQLAREIDEYLSLQK